MTALEAQILQAFLEVHGPELILRTVLSNLPRDRALAVLDAEYAAAEEAAKQLEAAKFRTTP